MSGIYGVWRKDGAAAAVLATLIKGAGGASARVIGPVTSGAGGVAVCARNAMHDLYEDERLIVACEIDIYNMREVREQVGARQGGPAAVVAALYNRFGTGFVDSLAGRFAVTIWDRRERQMVAAVDRFGLGRLVYYRDADMFVVGSRVDALAGTGEIPLDINPRAVVDLLHFSTTLAPETILSRVKRLPPAHLLISNDRETRIAPYWEMEYGRVAETDEKRLAERLYAVVENAVAATSADWDRSRTGAFLSGGTDSSTVVGLLRKIGHASPKAFSIGFREEAFNELEYAGIAARHFGAQHVAQLVGPEECFDALEDIFGAFDEPFGNASAAPTYFCAQAAKDRGVDFMLAGDGGDELFGGNQRYATDEIFLAYGRIPRVARKRVIEPLLGAVGARGGLIGRAKRYILRANLPAMERYQAFQFLSVCPPESVFDDGFLSALGGYSVRETPAEHYAQAHASDHLDRVLHADVKMTLGDSDLPKVTAACDLAGVTVRFPYLDAAVAEFACCLPARLKVKGSQLRYLFKKAFAELLPPEILRKKKHGFGIPVSTWIKTDRRFRELARDMLLSRRAHERGYFRPGLLEELFQKHEADDTAYYGDILWTFLALEMWHRRVVDAAAKVTA